MAYDLAKKNILKNDKCKECVLKFVCLGNCFPSSIEKDSMMHCGIFGDSEFLESLEIPFFYSRRDAFEN